MFKHIKILIVQSNKNTSIRINICFNWFWVNQPNCPREPISPWTCCSRTRWTPPCLGSETIRWFLGELLDIAWAALKCGRVKMREPFWTNIQDQITNQITHLLDILDQITNITINITSLTSWTRSPTSPSTSPPWHPGPDHQLLGASPTGQGTQHQKTQVQSGGFVDIFILYASPSDH